MHHREGPVMVVLATPWVRVRVLFRAFLLYLRSTLEGAMSTARVPTKAVNFDVRWLGLPRSLSSSFEET